MSRREQKPTGPERQWVTDDNGTRTWSYQGWVITCYTSVDPYCQGPNDQWLEVDFSRNELDVRFEAPYDGTVTVSVPIPVVLEFIKVSARPVKEEH
jgi:hypothetical protein